MKEFAGYEIEVPFGPAAGVLNGANKEVLQKQIIDVLRSPVGLATFGSLTWEGGIGNEPKHGVVYHHDRATGQTVNSMGLPNIGFTEARKLYPEWQKMADDQGKPLIPSMSPGKGEDPLKVLPRMAEGFAEAGAPAIEINYSCPNKITDEGNREPILAFDLEQMEEIDEEIMHLVGSGVTVVRKLAPYVGDKKHLIPEVGKIFARAHGETWLNLSNTVGGQRILNRHCEPALSIPDNIGGLSGPFTRTMARDQLAHFRGVLPENIGIISCNGVFGGGEVFDRVHNLDADLTEGATVYFENERDGISYGETGQRIAEQYAEDVQNSTEISEA